MKKLILAVCSLALLACAGMSTPAASSADLLHHRYDLESVNGKTIQPMGDNAERTPRIEFQEGNRVAGVICNFYNGPVTIEDGVMKGVLASTLMACIDPVLAEAENAFMQAVSEGAKLNLNKDKLIMTQGNNMLIFKLNDYK